MIISSAPSSGRGFFFSRHRRAATRFRTKKKSPSGWHYRLRFKTADPLELFNRTVWFPPRTTTCITPEIEYSLLKKLPEYLFSPTSLNVAVCEALPEAVAHVAFTE